MAKGGCRRKGGLQFEPWELKLQDEGGLQSEPWAPKTIQQALVEATQEPKQRIWYTELKVLPCSLKRKDKKLTIHI